MNQVKDTGMSYLEIERLVDDLFPKEESCYGTLGENPVTGRQICWGADPIAVEKANAVRALRAREWFYRHGPPDAPQLPLSWAEIDAMRFKDPFCHIVASFSRSLRGHNWDYNNHPSFDEFARGVLASTRAPEFVRADKELRKRYPPRRLPGLGPGLCWSSDH
jgi:hypothetical protein